MKTKLSVNINKVATIRNARGGNNPDILAVAKDCEAFGADGITVHPRPDERHIRRADVTALQGILRTEFNIEGYPTKEFMDLVLRVRPSQQPVLYWFKLMIQLKRSGSIWKKSAFPGRKKFFSVSAPSGRNLTAKIMSI